MHHLCRCTFRRYGVGQVGTTARLGRTAGAFRRKRSAAAEPCARGQDSDKILDALRRLVAPFGAILCDTLSNHPFSFCHAVLVVGRTYLCLRLTLRCLEPTCCAMPARRPVGRWRAMHPALQASHRQPVGLIAHPDHPRVHPPSPLSLVNCVIFFNS